MSSVLDKVWRSSLRAFVGVSRPTHSLTRTQQRRNPARLPSGHARVQRGHHRRRTGDPSRRHRQDRADVQRTHPAAVRPRCGARGGAGRGRRLRHRPRTGRGLSQTAEEPRWGGPAAALAAGMHNLRHSRVEHTVVIAADMPRVAGAVALLLDAIDDDHDGVIAVDSPAAGSTFSGCTALRRCAGGRRAGSTNAAMRGITGALQPARTRRSPTSSAPTSTPRSTRSRTASSFARPPPLASLAA